MAGVSPHVTVDVLVEPFLWSWAVWLLAGLRWILVVRVSLQPCAFVAARRCGLRAAALCFPVGPNYVRSHADLQSQRLSCKLEVAAKL